MRGPFMGPRMLPKKEANVGLIIAAVIVLVLLLVVILYATGVIGAGDEEAPLLTEVPVDTSTAPVDISAAPVNATAPEEDDPETSTETPKTSRKQIKLMHQSEIDLTTIEKCDNYKLYLFKDSKPSKLRPGQISYAMTTNDESVFVMPTRGGGLLKVTDKTGKLIGYHGTFDSRWKSDDFLMKMSKDGEFTIVSVSDDPNRAIYCVDLWRSDVTGGAKLSLKSNGVLSVTDVDNNVLWTSGLPKQLSDDELKILNEIEKPDTPVYVDDPTPVYVEEPTPIYVNEPAPTVSTFIPPNNGCVIGFPKVGCVNSDVPIDQYGMNVRTSILTPDECKARAQKFADRCGTTADSPLRAQLYTDGNMARLGSFYAATSAVVDPATEADPAASSATAPAMPASIEEAFPGVVDGCVAYFPGGTSGCPGNLTFQEKIPSDGYMHFGRETTLDDCRARGDQLAARCQNGRPLRTDWRTAGNHSVQRHFYEAA